MVELSADMSERMFRVHFDSSDYKTVSCKECLDYRLGQCEGKNYRGAECFACIEKHAKASHSVTKH
jgi:hypothetical protein